VKRIFILGGSNLQLDLIFEAKKLYFEVYLFDGKKDCEGQKYVDYFFHIDIKDKEAILKKAIELKPLIITTIASEIGNITSCFVSEKMALKSNSYEVAYNTTNKKSMKNIALKSSINIAKFKVIKNLEDLKEWSIFPVVIKPIDSSAGRGVSFVLRKEELEEAIKIAFNFTSEKEILIEEYIKGKQFSIETISSEGKHNIVSITEEYLSPLPKIIETQQLVPARLNKSEEEKLRLFAFDVLNSFNIKFGACHIEVRIDAKADIYLVEIASRMGGWRSELINLALGINYCQLLLFSLEGKNIEFQASRDEIAIVKMILSQKDFEDYKFFCENYYDSVISTLNIKDIRESKHLADSNGFYFLHIQDKKDLLSFIGEHK